MSQTTSKPRRTRTEAVYPPVGRVQRARRLGVLDLESDSDKTTNSIFDGIDDIPDMQSLADTLTNPAAHPDSSSQSTTEAGSEAAAAGQPDGNDMKEDTASKKSRSQSPFKTVLTLLICRRSSTCSHSGPVDTVEFISTPDRPGTQKPSEDPPTPSTPDEATTQQNSNPGGGRASRAQSNPPPREHISLSEVVRGLAGKKDLLDRTSPRLLRLLRRVHSQ